MDTFKSTWLGLVLGSLIRHFLTAFGTFLIAHHAIDALPSDAVVSAASDSAVGYIMVGVGLLLAAVNKSKVMEWVRTALHLDASRNNIGDVKVSAAQSNVAAKVPLSIAVGFLACALAVSSTTACTTTSGSGTLLTTNQALSNAKKAVTISAKIYDRLSVTAADVYHAMPDGTKRDQFKSEYIRVGDQYLHWANAARMAIDSQTGKPTPEFASNYQAAYDSLTLLIATVSNAQGGGQ